MLILRNSVIRSPRHLALLLSQIQFLLEHIFEKEKKNIPQRYNPGFKFRTHTKNPFALHT